MFSAPLASHCSVLQVVVDGSETSSEREGVDVERVNVRFSTTPEANKLEPDDFKDAAGIVNVSKLPTF